MEHEKNGVFLRNLLFQGFIFRFQGLVFGGWKRKTVNKNGWKGGSSRSHRRLQWYLRACYLRRSSQEANGDLAPTVFTKTREKFTSPNHQKKGLLKTKGHTKKLHKRWFLSYISKKKWHFVVHISSSSLAQQYIYISIYICRDSSVLLRCMLYHLFLPCRGHSLRCCFVKSIQVPKFYGRNSAPWGCISKLLYMNMEVQPFMTSFYE